jgi:3-methyladenine DNA glycosylase AlkC
MAERLKDIFFTQSSINLNDISKDHPDVVLDICRHVDPQTLCRKTSHIHHRERGRDGQGLF